MISTLRPRPSNPRRVTELTNAPWFRPGLGMAALAALGLAASDEEGTVLCPFRRCTGGYCPGCGVTRSIGRLLRGDVAGSWHHHPFVLLAVAQVAVLLAAWGLAGDHLRAVGRRRGPQLLLVVNAVLVTGIWIFRQATGQIPMPFG